MLICREARLRTVQELYPSQDRCLATFLTEKDGHPGFGTSRMEIIGFTLHAATATGRVGLS